MSNASFRLPSVAASAGKKCETESGIKLDDSGSARIRCAGALLREIVMRDACGPESFLSVMVAERVNEVILELDDIAGMQLMFELWVGE
jgi:hypothetical protein